MLFRQLSTQCSSCNKVYSLTYISISRLEQEGCQNWKIRRRTVVMTESTERRHGSPGTSAYRNVTLFDLSSLLGTFSLPFHSALNTLDRLLEIRILPVADILNFLFVCFKKHLPYSMATQASVMPKQAESSKFSGHAKSSAEGLVTWQHLRMLVPPQY